MGKGWASTTYGDTGGALAKDIIAVYIGLVLFVGVGAGFAIHHKLTKNTPLIVPLLECDFETDAVWNRGGGRIMREKERQEKELATAQGRDHRKWYTFSRLRDNVF